MGKKSDTSKAAATPAPETKLAAAKKPAAKKSAMTSTAAKSTATKPAAAKPKRVTVAKPTFTQDDIALRAYFISEKRHKAGLPGDAKHDWIEAERQLLAESKKKPAPKAKGAPAA